MRCPFPEKGTCTYWPYMAAGAAMAKIRRLGIKASSSKLAGTAGER
jgi:hypothetical protein